ncbi:HNH endonuclease [Peribacillus tepidiphilus]|uniref:HNH endonuclease n=1 Tax=Peribacillus tepidiphilus TaxID=2652445 RepID=UPI0012929B31|nr:HNH endonuclease [Peribacillus tepidiphilus]
MKTKELIQLIRTDNLMKFYKSKEWRELRQKAIKRDKYECQHCKRKGKVTTRKTLNKYGKPTKMEVNHIKPVRTHPHLALELDNLEYLCIDCHNIADGKNEMINKAQPKFVNEERW